MNILIIDDTQADHEMCVEYLGGRVGEHTFFHALTSREGIDIYNQQHIDCILLDYHLPDINGLEVLKSLGSGKRPVPVIMMTGEGDKLIAVMAM